MAYVVKGKGGSWELRRCKHTSSGPRSETLVTFSELTPTVADRAIGRSGELPLTSEQIEIAARRAGAPVALPAADRAARELLAELAAGRVPRSILGRLLVELLARPSDRSAADRKSVRQTDWLGPVSGQPTDAQRTSGEWAGASPADRAAALVDLLLLADALPATRTTEATWPPRFPRLTPAAP